MVYTRHLKCRPLRWMRVRLPPRPPEFVLYCQYIDLNNVKLDNKFMPKVALIVFLITLPVLGFILGVNYAKERNTKQILI